MSQDNHLPRTLDIVPSKWVYTLQKIPYPNEDTTGGRREKKRKESQWLRVYSMTEDNSKALMQDPA